MNNWSLGFWPNGFNVQYPKRMYGIIQLMSWPLKISKMDFMIKARISVNSEMVIEIDTDNEYTLDECNKNALNLCIFENHTIRLHEIKDMAFDVTVIIKRLYSLDGVEIPVEKWTNHNVQISNDE